VCGQPGDQPALRDLRRDEDQDAVTAILGRAVGPTDPGQGEGPPQGLVHGVTDGQLMGVGPGRIAEAFHVNDDDGLVDGRL
jgi:hypothetical protein